MGKHILNSALKMLIYANKQNSRMVDAIFLPQWPKEAQGKVRQSQERAAANNIAFSR